MLQILWCALQLHRVIAYFLSMPRPVHHFHCKVGLATVLGLLCSYATAQVCYNPLTVPNVNIKTSGACSHLATNSSGTVLAPGFQMGKFSGDGIENCTINFTSPVKGLVVDIGVLGCGPDTNFQCEKTVFTINGAHRPISSSIPGELTSPTTYSNVDPTNFGLTSTLIGVNSDGDLLGSDDIWANGSGKVKFSEGAVKSITISHVEDLQSLINPAGGWYNVCYDGVAPATITVNNVSKGGTGSFSFKGTSNANGFTTTDGAYAVTTVTAGQAASGSLVNLSAANTVTEIQEIATPGWTITGASCVDSNAAVSGNITGTFGALVSSTLKIPAEMVLPGANLQCTFNNTYTGLTVNGKVILDTGIGSLGVAHNGIKDGTEAGHSACQE